MKVILCKMNFFGNSIKFLFFKFCSWMLFCLVSGWWEGIRVKRFLVNRIWFFIFWFFIGIGFKKVILIFFFLIDLIKNLYEFCLRWKVIFGCFFLKVDIIVGRRWLVRFVGNLILIVFFLGFRYLLICFFV